MMVPCIMAMIRSRATQRALLEGSGSHGRNTATRPSPRSRHHIERDYYLRGKHSGTHARTLTRTHARTHACPHIRQWPSRREETHAHTRIYTLTRALLEDTHTLTLQISFVRVALASEPAQLPPPLSSSTFSQDEHVPRRAPN